jgi:phosphate uptake regulator
MRRKLIKQGKDGFTIYLPREWVVRRELKHGDEIHIDEVGASLLIRATGSGKREITIKRTKEKPFNVKLMLTHAYRTGYDRIVLDGLNDDELKQARTLVSELLLGFEVVESANERLVAENVTEPTDEKYDTLVRRVFLINTECLEMFHEGAKTGWNRLAEITELRLQVDKYVLYCLRVLCRKMHSQTTLFAWEQLKWIYQVQHAIFYMYSYCSRKKPKLSKETIEVIVALKAYWAQFHKGWLEKDLYAVSAISHTGPQPQFVKIIDLLEKGKGKDAAVLAYLREPFRLIQLARSPVISMMLYEEMTGEKQ